MALTDLRGTKWYLNETLSSPIGKHSIDFICNSITYNEISFQSESGFYMEFIINSVGGDTYLLAYTESMFDTPHDGWRSEEYRTIKIVGGTDTTNTFLINWFESNAILVQDYIVPESVLLDLADDLRENAGWSSNQKLSWPNGFISAINAAQGIDGFDFSTFIDRTISEAIAVNVTGIGSYAFYNCTNLSIASFPLVMNIGNSAFCGCDNLSIISFPSATNIESYAFTFCENISIANFPLATSIGSYAFADCFRLSIASFPSVTSIENNAFDNCYNLSLASFPLVTNIGNNAFAECYNLLSLYLLGSSIATLSNANAFTSTPISTYTTQTNGVRGSIFVRQSLLANWKAATNWATYSARFVGLTEAQIAEL